VLVNKGMEALTVAHGDFECPLVRYDDYDLSERVVQDGTPMACLQVGFNLCAKDRIDVVVDEI